MESGNTGVFLFFVFINSADLLTVPLLLVNLSYTCKRFLSV